MSERRGFLSGWSFRASRPVFEPGQQIAAYVTDFDPDQGTGVARIGDSLLTVHGVTAEDLDAIVELKVRSFDAATHRGLADRLRAGQPDRLRAGQPDAAADDA